MKLHIYNHKQSLAMTFGKWCAKLISHHNMYQSYREKYLYVCKFNVMWKIKKILQRYVYVQ